MKRFLIGIANLTEMEYKGEMYAAWDVKIELDLPLNAVELHFDVYAENRRQANNMVREYVKQLGWEKSAILRESCKCPLDFDVKNPEFESHYWDWIILK